VRDPESPKGSQQPAAQPGAAELPLEAVSPRELRALEEQMEAPVPRELEADISTLDDEGIRCEGKREVLRRRRDGRKAARVADAQDSARKLTERRLQVGVFRLLVYIAGVATVVTLIGALEENVEIVRAGVAALCAVAGLGTYRLLFWVGRR
jgi:hypothetical protein